MLDNSAPRHDNKLTMTHEYEPGREHGNWHIPGDGEIMTPRWLVEALIVRVDDEGQHYAVTRVLEGSKEVYDSFSTPLHSPVSGLALGPDKAAYRPYRVLLEDPEYESVFDEYTRLDTLLTERRDVQVGDRVRIQRWNYPISNETPNSWTIHRIDSVTVLESGIDVAAEEERVRAQKEYVRKNFAGIFRRLEQIQLQTREQLSTETETPVRWRGARDGVHVAHYTYGDGPILDHFVDIKAAPYSPHGSVPLGGDNRFTQSGAMYVARDITAGLPSNELVKASEPMVELSAHAWTETAHNPAVNALRIDFVVDGVRYYSRKEPELSSHYFKEPGHDMHFEGYHPEGQEYDGVEVVQEELESINRFSAIDHDLAIQAIHLSYDVEYAQAILASAESPQELTDGRVPPTESAVVKATQRLADIKEMLVEFDRLRANELEKLQPVIDGIMARPSDTKMMTGGRLLVPVSKLGEVRVVVAQREESENK